MMLAASSTYILGISAFFHDSAACLLCDGELVAAAQEERFSRVKNDHGFPESAITYCLEFAGIEIGRVDYIAYFEKPLLKFDRLIETHLAYAPKSFGVFRSAMPLWAKEKLRVPSLLDRGLKGGFRGRYIFLEHHESHGAAAFYPSPFEEAAILTIDGVGEWATASIGRGRGRTLELMAETQFPHSLGLLYSAFTFFLGFKVNSGEYKMMGLAPYGEPKYVDLILDRVVSLHQDGSFQLDMTYFAFCHREVMTSKKIETILDGPPRVPESHIDQRHLDIAASIQALAEKIVLLMARHTATLTGSKNLVMAGGVAQNCVANGKIVESGIFDRVWVQPAASDAGSALGAAFFVWHQLLEKRRTTCTLDSQRGSLLGPEYSEADIAKTLAKTQAQFDRPELEADLVKAVASHLADGQVVGHFFGPMEFGPRALGNRSILGDPRSAKMQSLINRKIKFRESFRPFAPSVLASEAKYFFDLPKGGQDLPYMTFVHQVKGQSPQPKDQGLEALKSVGGSIPAVTHVDGTARIQTLTPERNNRLFAIVSQFSGRTGCPLVINTSFNVRGEPIVCSPEDALRCFMATDMDILVLGNCILQKKQQSEAMKKAVSALGGNPPPRQNFVFLGVDLHPSPKKLKQFALSCAILFAVLGTFEIGDIHPLALFGSAGACLAFGLWAPTFFRPLFVLISCFTWPIGLVVSFLVTTVFYFGLLTPLGVVRRIFGNDRLRRKPSGYDTTFWITQRRARKMESYFRQY